MLAGSAGWLSEPIFDLVRNSRFADSIHLTGYVPGRRPAALACRRNLLLLPFAIRRALACPFWKRKPPECPS